MSDRSSDGTERQPHDYDVDDRFAHIRVDVLGQEFRSVVRVCEQFPHLPDGVSVYVEHIDATDLKNQDKSDTDCYPSVRGKCPECGSHSLFVGKGGYVACSFIDCPDPSTPSDVLGARNGDTDIDRSGGNA